MTHNLLKSLGAIAIVLGTLLSSHANALAEDAVDGQVDAKVNGDDVAAADTAKAHPLDAEIDDAKTRLASLERRVQDYSCRFIKRERVGGELRDHEIIDMKVRHEPFSVHMKFLKPDNVKGQIVAYIEGKNEGKMIAKPVGFKSVLGPISLRPDGPLAMEGQRYPITHVGFVNLTKELIKVAENDRKYGECKVAHYKGAKIGNRTCTVTEVIHPVRRKAFRFYRARVFVDDELNLPIRFVSWTWPTEEDGKPVLEEEYTYTNVKLNRGYTDADFTVQ